MALPAGWYPVTGDPTGTQRYWDGEGFTTGPKRDLNSRNRAGFVKPNSATRWRMATASSRAIAAIVDFGAPIAIVLGIGNALDHPIPEMSVSGWFDEPKLVAVILGCMLVNQVVLVGLWGVSLGGTLLGLRVVDARDRDRSPGLPRALGRFLLAIPGFPITVLFFVLGKRRGLHDVATGTAVVYG